MPRSESSLPFTREPERFITDGSGDRVGVIVPVEQYQALLDAAEELEEIRAYDDAMASGDDVLDFEAAVAEIETARG